jgi:hypothetical protein
MFFIEVSSSKFLSNWLFSQLTEIAIIQNNRNNFFILIALGIDSNTKTVPIEIEFTSIFVIKQSGYVTVCHLITANGPPV